MTTKLSLRTSATPHEISAPANPWVHFDSLFDDLHGQLFFPFGQVFTGESGGQGFLPALTDIEDKGKHYEVRTELPGVPKEKIDVRVSGNTLVIHAESDTETETESKEKNYVRRERTYQGFHRSFELPENVLSDKVEARYQDGVLAVTVPKANPVSERKVSVS